MIGELNKEDLGVDYPVVSSKLKDNLLTIDFDIIMFWSMS